MTKSEDEYNAGYNAFMKRCGYYALAHADQDGMWDEFWKADKDEGLEETADYLEGWEAAKRRMHREVGMDFGACGTPRDAERRRFKLLLKVLPGGGVALSDEESA